MTETHNVGNLYINYIEDNFDTIQYSFVWNVTQPVFAARAFDADMLSSPLQYSPL